MPQKHTQHSCVAHPMYPELYKCNSRESTFVEFCIDGINLFDENNFIDSLDPGRDSNPDPSALKPSEYHYAIDLLWGYLKIYFS
jgi:hypothetical protein